MLTYQDYIKAKEEGDALNFVWRVIGDYCGSEQYRTAQIGDDYMHQKNTTISEFRRLLYDINGKAQLDTISPNYKLPSSYYKTNIVQLTQYLLANGVNFEKDDTKEALGGAPFDITLSKIVRKALAQGVCYGYYSDKKVTMFSALEFAPLVDEETGSIRAGVRWWTLGGSKPMRITLYTEDGYVELVRDKDGGIRPMDGYDIDKPRAYVELKVQAEADDTAIIEGRNYAGLPIVPCYGNFDRVAEIVGKRFNIDAYDLIKSGEANNVDEASYIYWAVQNAGGMDDVDFAEFLRRVRTLHVANVDDTQSATPHTLNVPVQEREMILTRLEQDIYNDAMTVNMHDIAAGNVTATAIKAAFARQDYRTDELEYCVLEFLDGLLALAGIDDTAKFNRNRMTNDPEITQMVLSCADYLDTETILEKLPFLAPEEVQAVMDRKAEEDMERFTRQMEQTQVAAAVQQGIDANAAEAEAE